MMYFEKHHLVIVLLCAVGASTTAYADSMHEYNETVVSTSLTEEDKSKTPAFTNVVYGEDILANGYSNLADVLSDLANVHNQSSGGRDSINIRGLDKNYTLLLVDGMRVSSTGALWRGGDFDYSSVPLNSIERVELIRGPAAAIYGSDAIGGVVNIITKKASGDWDASVYVAYRQTESDGGKNRVGVGLSTQGAITDTLGASFNIEKTNREAWTDPKKHKLKEIRSIEEKNTVNLSTKLNWDINDANKLAFSFSRNTDERPKSMVGLKVNRKTKKKTEVYLEQDIQRNSVEAQYDADLGWGQATYIAKYEKSKIKDFNSRYKAPKQRTLHEKNIYNKAFINTTLGNQQILAGLELRNQEIKDAATYKKLKGKSKEVAVFAQNNVMFTPKLSVLFGARYDNSKQFGSHVSPKLYTVYSATDNLKFKAGVSRAFKAPRPHQSTKDYKIISCGGRCFLLADPNLKPETSNNYELGLDYAKGGLSLNTALFHTSMKNQIAAPYDRKRKQRNWVNLNKSEITGLELDTHWFINDEFDVKAQFTHLFKAESEDVKGKKSDLIRTPKRIAKLGFGYRPFDLWKTGLDIHYIGEQTQFRTRKVLPSYKTVSWKNSVELDNGLSINAGVNNLTDVSLHDVDKNYTDTILGRNVYLKMRYDF